METRTLETVRIPTSFYYDGLWQAADWSATVTDETTGQVLLTVILPQDGHPAPLAAVRLSMDDVAKLRQLAGFGRGCAQAQEQRYDCRTTGQRIADLEQRVKGLTTALGACASSATVHSQGERLDAWLSSVRNLDSRVAYLERRAQGITGPDGGL